MAIILIKIELSIYLSKLLLKAIKIVLLTLRSLSIVIWTVVVVALKSKPMSNSKW